MNPAPPVINTDFSMSTLGQRSIGKCTHHRGHQPRILERHVTRVREDQGVAYNDWAAVRGAEQVGQVGVVSAAGIGGSRLGRDTGSVDRRRSA
jgi:hypothetical protein